MVALAVLLCGGAGVSHAQVAQEPTPLETPGDAAYYYDSSALTLYGALVGYALVKGLMTPPLSPRLFETGEGGGEFKGDTLPNWTLGPIAGTTLSVIAAAPTAGRWYHVKGFGGAFAGTLLLTDFTKATFGRHRPDYQPGHPEAGQVSGRRSFFSGHSSLTLVSTTYLGLFLRRHAFARVRPQGVVLPWWEASAYAALAAFSVYVPVTRVTDNRHHIADVVVGATVGAAVAVGFFAWQERRLRKARALHHASGSGSAKPGQPSSWVLSPTLAPAGLSALGRF